MQPQSFREGVQPARESTVPKQDIRPNRPSCFSLCLWPERHKRAPVCAWCCSVSLNTVHELLARPKGHRRGG